MNTQIYVNLPVKDLDKSMAFFTAVGFKNNPRFTDKTAACMAVTDEINAMLLTHPKFKDATGEKPIVDAHKMNEVLTCLSFADKAKVNEIVDSAIAAGGVEVKEAKDDGLMYHRGFSDLDGHIWEIIWMNSNGITKS